MKVRIKRIYCESEAESRLVFDVVEDNGDRCLIRPVGSSMAIVPTEMVTKEMVEVIE